MRRIAYSSLLACACLSWGGGVAIGAGVPEKGPAEAAISTAWANSGPATAAEIAAGWVKKHPGDAALRARWVDALVQSGNLDAAGRALSEWERSSAPREGAYWEQRGVWLEARGEREEATAAWVAGGAFANGWDCAVRADGRLLSAGRWAELDRMLTTALVHDPGQPRLRAWRGRARLQLKAWEGAGEDIRAANAAAPADAEVKKVFPGWERFEADRARLSALDAAVAAAAPGVVVPLLERAAFLLGHGLRAPALEDLRAARSGFDSSPTLRLVEAQALRAASLAGMAQGDWRKVQPLLQVAGPDLSRDPVAATRLVEADRKLAGASGPERVGLLLGRAWLWRQVRQPALALADADAVLAVEPSNPQAGGERASALAALDRSREAMEAWALAFQNGLEDVGLLLAGARHAAGRADHETAVRFAGRAASLGAAGDAEEIVRESEWILGKRSLPK